MHQRGNPLILLGWFVTTPLVVVLFSAFGWGSDGILAAIALSALAWWVISRLVKKAMGAFPDKKSALRFLASGQVTQFTAITPYGQEEQDTGAAWETSSNEEEGGELYSQPGSFDQMEDLHPAIIPAGMQSGRLPSRPRYSLNLGSHTLDLDTALEQTLIVEQMPEGTRTLTRILAEELGGNLRFTVVVVDFTDAFQTLLTELPGGFLLGGFEAHNALPEPLRRRAAVIDRGNASKLGQSLMQERGQCIFRFSSFESYAEAGVNLLLFLQGIYRWERGHIASGGHPIPCVIMLNRAHLFLPGQNAYSVARTDPTVARLLPKHLLHYLTARGENGMYLYLITEYASRMSSEVLDECGLWLLREPQYEELHYLSRVTGLNLLTQMSTMRAEQALLLDVVDRKSFPILLRQSRSLFEMDAMSFSMSPMLKMMALTANSDAVGAETGHEAAYLPVAQSPGQQALLPATPPTVARDTSPGTASQAPGDFPEPWLAYASFLYSIGRLTPTALRRIPDQWFDLAEALGLKPVKGQDTMNRNRAFRLMGIVQGMGRENRARYVRQVRQAAPMLTPSLGGARIQETGPPQRNERTLWQLPRPDLLASSPTTLAIAPQKLQETAQHIAHLLAGYDVYVEIRIEECAVGHTITRYAARPLGKPKLKYNTNSGQMEGVRDPGGLLMYEKMTTVDQIEAREKDLATRLAVDTARIARVPGKPFVGIEIPHLQSKRLPVGLRDIVGSPAYQQAASISKVLFPLGKDVAGEIRFVDLSNSNHPHLLIAGASGGGKSVLLRAGIASIAMYATPDEVRMWMVDPKMVEFTPFADLPHLIGEIVTDIQAIPQIISHALNEVFRRYEHFKRLGVTNLEEYRRLRTARQAEGTSALKNLPELLLIIDELGDALMTSPKEVEEGLCRLGQIGRAAGLHLIVATQRPEVAIVTGRIKANLPYRVALRVSSASDSRIILDRGGAESLVGRGDMLAGTSGLLERLQGANIERSEVDAVVAHWKRQALHLQLASPFLAEQPPEQEQAIPLSDESGSQERPEEEGTLLQRIIEELPGRKTISVNMIKQVYHVSHETARPIIEQLMERGLIGDYIPAQKGHPVRVVNLQQCSRTAEQASEGGDAEENSLSS